MNKTYVVKLLMLFFALTTAFSMTAVAQSQKVSLSLNNASLKDLFGAIEARSQYRFSYRNVVIDRKKNITLTRREATVKQLLDELLPPRGLSWTLLSEKSIVITRRKVPRMVADATSDDGEQTIKGCVRDDKGESIIGASIRVKGTTNGSITDLDGNFTLKVAAGATLVVSYIGYVSAETKATPGKTLDLVLHEDNKQLSETVVVGYGSMRKKDLTGSVVQIKPGTLSNEAPKTVQDVLRGTPGLSVGFSNTAKGGGTMNLRGQRSVYTDGDHNAPLVILDGMMFYGELSEINPNDIAQIDVLKDASSSAVYGAKAANGVIIVTTKKGRTEKPTINLSVNVGFSTMGESRKPMTPDQYLKYREDFYTADTYGVNPQNGRYEAYQTGNTKPGFYARPTRQNLDRWGLTVDEWRAESTQEASMSDNEVWARRIGLNASETTLANYLSGTTYNWYDQSFRTGLNQDYNVSVSGLSKRSNYYFSLGYMKNEGVVEGDDYTTIRSNLKLSTDITSWLQVGATLNFQNRTDGDISCNWESQILDNSPFVTPYDSEGRLVAHPMGENAYWKGYNFFFDRQYMDRQSGYTVFNGTLNTRIKLPFNVTYTFNYAPRYQVYRYRNFRSGEHPDWQAANDERVTRSQTERFDWSLNNTIAWDYTFRRRHHVILTLVQEAEQRESWADQINARNIKPSEALGFHATANADKTLSSFSSTDTKESATGYLARAFYSYDDKYMATFSFRRDGYSAFGTNNPYANFLSGALAWTFTNEKWLDWGLLDSGKLRLSYGENGNRSLADSYIALANLALGSYTQSYVTPGGVVNEMFYLYVSRLANPGLEWEKTSSWNIGLDLSFLNGRIRASLDYYRAATTDMIMPQSLPDFTGFSSITTNLGKVMNTGFEFVLNTENMRKRNIEWQTAFTFTYNNNEIKSLYGQYQTIIDAAGHSITKEVDDQTNGWFIGKPISAIWNYKVTGIWQTGEREEAARYGQRPGDPKVANLYTADDKEDGTPVYNNNDKTFIGQATPPVNWSMRNTFTLFKDWSFSFNIYSLMGHKSLDTNYLNNDNSYSQVTNCRNQYQKSYWTVDDPSDTYARLSAQGPTGISAPARVVDRSFIRLENISLAYNVPKRFIERLKVSSARVFVNVRNVCTWTKEWEYGDPETGTFSPRNYTLGVNVAF